MLKLQDLATRPDLQLGALSISPSRRLVEGAAGKAHLEPLTMQVLLLLIDGAGRVVTRAELFDQCWGGVMVGDDSLNRTIGKVRRVGAEVAPGYFEVETIPRTGYRLTGEILAAIEAQPDGGAAKRERSPGVSRRVLLGGGAAALGLGSLAAWLAFKPGTDARFTQLVERADQLLRYEYSGRRQSAISFLEQAVAIHPDDSHALGLLAYARALQVVNVPARGGAGVHAADRAIRAALAADSDDPHARLAVLLFRQDTYDWAGTEEDLLGILRTAPRNLFVLSRLGALYQAAGRLRASSEKVDAQIAIDPISPGPRFKKALQLWVFGQTDEAFRLSERLIRVWPDHDLVWNARFLILAFTGRPHAALDMIDDASTRPATITPERMAQWHPTLAALERPAPATIAAAREANLIAARQSPGQAAYAVMALGGIGEIDAAFDVAEGFLLSRGKIITRRPSDPTNTFVNNPSWRHTQWLWTPPLAKLRLDPRFGPLCEAIGLTDYWRQRGIEPDLPLRRVA